MENYSSVDAAVCSLIFGATLYSLTLAQKEISSNRTVRTSSPLA